MHYKFPTRKLSFIFLNAYLFFLISSCVSPSNDEEKLYNNLKSKYNCVIDIKKGITTASKKESKTYFQVSISNCNYIDNPDFVASSIALETFKTIKKKNYTHINIRVSDSQYEYKSSDLKEVLKVEPYFHEVFNKIRDKKYQTVYNDLWNKLKKDNNLEDFSKNLEVISSKMNFKDLSLKGFKIIRENINDVDTEVIHLIGYFDLKQNNACMFELFVPYKFTRTIYGLNLEEI